MQRADHYFFSEFNILLLTRNEFLFYFMETFHTTCTYNSNSSGYYLILHRLFDRKIQYQKSCCFLWWMSSVTSFNTATYARFKWEKHSYAYNVNRTGRSSEVFSENWLNYLHRIYSFSKFSAFLLPKTVQILQLFTKALINASLCYYLHWSRYLTLFFCVIIFKASKSNFFVIYVLHNLLFISS